MPGDARAGRMVAEADRDPVVICEGVSKRYPAERVVLFPPVVSLFERGIFRRERPTPPAEDALHDDEDEDEDEHDLERTAPPATRGPTDSFWALRDVSFRVPAGGGLGVLGGPGAGKSTLLRILSGQAFPTDGRVLIRGPVCPPPTELQRELRKTAGDLVSACRLFGLDKRVVRAHEAEINELAGLPTARDPQVDMAEMGNLAVAAAVVLPSSVLLLEEARGMDEAFGERVVERIRARLSRGSALVLASRSPELVQRLCDEVLVLDDGVVTARGEPDTIVPNYAPPRGARMPTRGRADAQALRKPRIASANTPFSPAAAILSASVFSTAGPRRKRFDAADELVVKIVLESAVPDIEVLCSVSFVPRRGDRTPIRAVSPTPLALPHPGIHVVAARTLPWSLGGAVYDVRADAIISTDGDPETRMIAREAGRIRIRAEEADDIVERAAPRDVHWDDQPFRRIDADWTLRPRHSR
jgi:ABC-2 type transport system ATP-binding protein